MVSTAHDLNRERQWICARRMSGRRHELGLTQRDVVERLASLGLTTTNRTLSAMEHGQGVDVGRLPELAVALDTTVTYLLGLTADPLSWLPDSTPTPVFTPLPFAATVPARMPGPASVTCSLCAADQEPAGNGVTGHPRA